MSTEATEAVIQQNELSLNALTVTEEAESILVLNQYSYDRAIRFIGDVLNPMLGKIDAAYDPICQKAHETWKTATETRKRYRGPVEEAKKLLNFRIGAYEIEQTRIADDLRRNAQREANTLTAIIGIPVPAITPVSDAASHNRAPGVSTTWTAEVYDIKLLCRAIADGKASSNLIAPNQSALNGMARAQGRELENHLPGVRSIPTARVTIRKAT